MVEKPVSRSLFDGETKYDDLDLEGTTPMLKQDAMRDIFDETFELSSVERMTDTDVRFKTRSRTRSVTNDFTMLTRLSRWFTGGLGL